MILKNTDLWLSDADLILVTTNSTINSRGELVMGRGAALQAKAKFPVLPKMLAAKIVDGARYGVLIVARQFLASPPPPWHVGAFQVKYHYADNAKLELVENSVECLLKMEMAEMGIARAAMNFPAIGWGGLDRKLVLPIIERLPDSVEVHEWV